MPDFRAYAPTGEHEPSEIVLSREESSHLIRVSRARQGDTVVVFDGRGREWICECVEPDRSAARLKVRFQQTIPPLPHRITLAQALPKGKTMDSIVRKATELGVSRIVPLQSERTEVHLEEQRSRNKMGKWEVTAIEAAKQSGNSYLPEILPVQTVQDYLSSPPPADLKLIASLQPGATHLNAVLDNIRPAPGQEPFHAVWMIGPEGDFTMAEIRSAEGAGFSPISLGPLVLRCETAAVYALSILNHELQHRLS